MGLFQRIDRDSAGDMDTHALQWAFVLWAGGSATVTRTAIVDKLSLDASDEIDLDALRAIYNSKSANGKRDYLQKAEAAFGLAEKGYFTQAQWRAELEI